MPRAARIVVPGLPHHVTQRGNRRQDIFFNQEDWFTYKALMAKACTKHGVECLAWCLMPNHVHLVLVPAFADGLRAVLSSVHTAYSQRINLREGASGHLFQGRFASYAMDDSHLLAAIRYVENNPVKAGLVQEAAQWRWSSARSRVDGISDGLTAPTELTRLYPNWSAMLAQGWEAGAEEPVEQALASGLPQCRREWLAGLAAETGLSLVKRDRGRPRRSGQK
ncbi:MAG: transposase [Novosphingobium sp.]